MQQHLTGRRRLYLMRHGHVDYFAPGLTDFTKVSLTDEGVNQVTATGKALQSVAFDAVFCSGLKRTVESAALVVVENQGELPAVMTLPAFEEVRGGSVVVENREKLAATLAYSYDMAMEPGATFLPEGELFADAEQRIVAGLSAMLAEQSWSTALLVAHDAVNRIILGHVCGAGLAGMAHFEQDLACVNVLDFDVIPSLNGGVEIARIVIKAVNMTAYDMVKRDLPRTSLEHMFGIDFGGARPRV